MGFADHGTSWDDAGGVMAGARGGAYWIKPPPLLQEEGNWEMDSSEGGRLFPCLGFFFCFF